MAKINTTYDVGAAFEAIEEELIASIIRNMRRHKLEEIDEDRQWAMWQTLQLEALEKFKRENREKYKSQFRDINKQLEALISIAHSEGGMEQEEAILKAIKKGLKVKRTAKGVSAEFFKLNEKKLEALIKATMDDMEKAEYAILRKSEDMYRKVIFNAQVYANTGAGTYEKAVDMATKDFLAAGLTCVEYANGAVHTLADYADMAIRTAAKRAYLQGEGEKRQEWGISTVIMNKRGHPCPKCLPFAGKILIDDVWSGGSRKDGPYPLMSAAIAAGLYHPRCRDVHTTYFPGISTPGKPWTKEEIKELEAEAKREERRQYAERQVRKYGRMARHSLDEENQKRYAARRGAWKKRRSRVVADDVMSVEGIAENTGEKLKAEIGEARKEKELLKNQVQNLEKEEKALTQKVYFDLTGTENDMSRLKAVSQNKKALSNQIEDLENQILEKQETYKAKAEARIRAAGYVKEIKLSKRITPESVDMIENTLRELKEKYEIMPEGVIFNPAKVPDGTASYNWLDDKLYLSNRFSDLDKYADIARQSESSLAEYRKHYQIEEKAKERIEKADKILADSSVKGYEREKAVLEKAMAEIDLNTSRQAVRKDLSDVLVHEYGHFIHRHANVDYVQKKNVFGMKTLGGRMVGKDWEYEINTAYSRVGKVEASKISKYAAKNPYETFAEGFLALEKGEKIPEKIADVIEDAKRRAGVRGTVAKTIKPDIMERNRDTFKMNLQMFAESDIKNQESGSLKRAIRKYQKQIDSHRGKIEHPEQYIDNWNDMDPRMQEGLKRHWSKEIRNFDQSIQDRVEELKKRGDYDD